MAPRRLVTWQELAALGRELAEADIKDSRLVRTCSMVHEFVGYNPPEEPAHIRMSFFMNPRAYWNRQNPYVSASRFSYGELGALGSMTVELMLDGHSESASSSMMTMKGKWPELYGKVAGYEFPELLAGVEVKDSMIYGKIHDATAKLEKHGLATYVPPTNMRGSYYKFSEEDRGKIITLGCG